LGERADDRSAADLAQLILHNGDEHRRLFAALEEIDPWKSRALAR